MSTPASLKIETSEHLVTTHTAAGEVTALHAFRHMVLDTGSQVVRINLDATDWSRLLAAPGVAQPVTFDLLTPPAALPRAG